MEEFNFDMENIMSGTDLASEFLDAQLPELSDGDKLLNGDLEDEVVLDKEKETKQPKTTETDAESFFGDDEFFMEDSGSEGVGSGGKEDKTSSEDDTFFSEGDSTSPEKTSVHSSIAKLLKEEGVLPELESLDEEELANIKNQDDLNRIIKESIEKRIDSDTKRVKEALDVGVEVPVIQQYENTIKFLNSVTEDAVKDESPKGQALREQLIFASLKNRGYKPERAEKIMRKSFELGTDIEDAQEALNENKEYFSQEYQKVIETAKVEQERELEEIKREAEELKNSILNTEEFNGTKLSKLQRQKVIDNLTKPVFTDEDGYQYNAIQKYEYDNPKAFKEIMGYVFTLTNGFKDFDGLVKSKARKAGRQTIKEIEHALQGSKGGKFNYMSGGETTSTDKNAYEGMEIAF